MLWYEISNSYNISLSLSGCCFHHQLIHFLLSQSLVGQTKSGATRQLKILHTNEVHSFCWKAICPKRHSSNLKSLQTARLLRAHASHTNRHPVKCQLTNAPKIVKKALPFPGFQQVLWYTKLLSAYSHTLLHWVRHNFIAASATFTLHSHCFSLSLFEEGIFSMFSQTACPWLF